MTQLYQLKRRLSTGATRWARGVYNEVVSAAVVAAQADGAQGAFRENVGIPACYDRLATALGVPPRVLLDASLRKYAGGLVDYDYAVLTGKDVSKLYNAGSGGATYDLAPASTSPKIAVDGRQVIDTYGGGALSAARLQTAVGSLFTDTNKLSVILAFQSMTAGDNYFLDLRFASGQAQPGLYIRRSGGKLTVNAKRSSGDTLGAMASSADLPPGWHVVGVTLDIVSGAGHVFLDDDGEVATNPAILTSNPSANFSWSNGRMMVGGNPTTNGAVRFWRLAVVPGVTMSAAQFLAERNAWAAEMTALA